MSCAVDLLSYLMSCAVDLLSYLILSHELCCRFTLLSHESSNKRKNSGEAQSPCKVAKTISSDDQTDRQTNRQMLIGEAAETAKKAEVCFSPYRTPSYTPFFCYFHLLPSTLLPLSTPPSVSIKLDIS